MARRLAKLCEYFRVDCDLIFLLDHAQCASTAKSVMNLSYYCLLFEPRVGTALHFGSALAHQDGST